MNSYNSEEGPFKINYSVIPNRIHNLVDNRTLPLVYHLPQPRIEYAKRHVTYTGVKLPNNLKLSTSSISFKRKYQKLLLSYEFAPRYSLDV